MAMTISQRIAILLALASTILIGGSALWDLHDLRQRNEEHLRLTGEGISLRLAATASKALYQLDEAVMADAISGEFADPLVACVVVREGKDANGRIFSGQIRGPDGAVVPCTALDDRASLAKTERVVLHDNATIGLVQVLLDRSPAMQDLRHGTYVLLGRALGMNVVLVAILILILQRFVVRPIQEVRDRLQEVAQGDGDLTRRLPVKGSDEISELSRWFNLFVGNIQQLVGNLADTATSLTQAAEHLERTAGTLSNGVEETSQRSKSALHSGKSIENDISGVSVSIQGMAVASQEIAQRTVETANISQSASTAGDHASVAIGKLGTSTQQIAEVLVTITTIANQVRMLSLNATIEAAKAGQAGKGFAVVANEVQVLANNTHNAAEAIKDRIQAILADSAEVTAAISRINSSVQQVSASTTAIAAAADKQSATSMEMGTVLGRVNCDSRAMSAALGSVGQVAEESAKAAGQVRGTAGELTGRAADLRALIGRFKT